MTNGTREDLKIRRDGTLVLGNRLFVPQNEELMKEILDETRIQLMLCILVLRRCSYYEAYHYWSGMKNDIEKYVKMCLICHEVKVERQKPIRLSQSLHIPIWKWEEITMDFLYKLPKTRANHDII